jgi:hypothetical protein
MINNEQEFTSTLERIANLQKQVVHLQEVENNPENYRLSVGGFLAELDRIVTTTDHSTKKERKYRNLRDQ